MLRLTALKVLHSTYPGSSAWLDLLPSHSVHPELRVCGRVGVWIYCGVPLDVVESMFPNHCPSHH